MFEGEPAVRPGGIDDRRRIRQGAWNLMVIQDDGVDAQGLGIGNRIVIGNAAVDGDDQAAPPLANPVDGLPVQTVSFVDPVRNVVLHGGIELLQELDQNDDGGDPVRVVIPENGYLLTPVNSLQRAVDGPAHVLEQEGTVKVVEGGGEIAPCLVGIEDVPARQDAGNDRMNSELPRQAILNIPADIRHFPGCGG